MATWTLATLLKTHPWPQTLIEKNFPLDCLWHFPLKIEIDQIWPFLIDTSSFNAYLGLPEIEFEEVSGKLYGKTQYGAIQMEWHEVEWEWEYGKTVKNARDYSRGIGSYSRGIYLLEPSDNGSLDLYVYFGWIPKGRLSRWVLQWSIKRLHQKFHQALLHITECVKTGEACLTPPSILTIGSNTYQKIDVIAQQLKRLPINQPLVERIINFVKTAGDHELERIRVRVLARQWQVDERDCLVVFLHATRQGLLLLTWDAICPHCRNSRQDIQNLGDIPEKVYCEVCQIDFDLTELNAIEVTFHVHPSIREVTPHLFCSAEPSTKPHIQLQVHLNPQETKTLSTLVGSGHYRMRQRGSKVYDWVQVHAALATDVLVWEEPNNRQLSIGAHPILKIQNRTPHAQTYILEKYESDQEALRPTDIFNLQEFRDLFSEEAIASGMRLDIGEQTLLFTDIVGSTKLYVEQGDIHAFTEVKRHFVQIYNTVQQQRGAVIKTIGDAVMAAFNDPLDAFKTALLLQNYFTPQNPQTDILIRISLNLGPCMAVQLNNNIDYFGTTVNIAAKIQRFCDAGQIVFTEAIRSTPAIQQFLSQHNLSLAPLEYQPSPEQATYTLFRLNNSPTSADLSIFLKQDEL